MARGKTMTSRAILHLAGLLVLGVAWFSLRRLAAVTTGHAGDEPALAYLLALTTFVLASSGAALTVMGSRLFDKVVVADRWLHHVPLGFVHTQKPSRPAD